MISVILQGVSPVMPIFVIVLLLLFSVVVSFWSYQYLSAIGPWKKWGLISLRASVLSLLILLLLNPFRTAEVEETEPARIAVYLDDSQSMGITRGDYDGLNSYRAIIGELQSQQAEGFEYDYYRFSGDITEGSEIEAFGTSTNLHNVMDHITQNESDYRASIVVSDGIFTQGRNPVYTAQRLSNPVITIPAGDTSTVKDIILADVNYNETIYTNTRHRFTADVQQMGFSGDEATVQFLLDGELIDTRDVPFSTSSESHLVEFTHEFTEPGFYDIQINIPAKGDEFTDQNNRSSFTVEVIDDKTRILSLAFEVHPDVRSVRKLLATDQQNELVSSTVIGPGRFIGDDPMLVEEDFDLVFLHGLPAPGSELLQWLNEQSFPVVYMATPGSAEQPFDSRYAEFISLRTEGTQALLDVHVEPGDNGVSHPLLEGINQATANRFPSLKAYEGQYNTSPLAEVLLTARFQANSTDIPLLIAEDTQVRRLVTINSFGWYRFEQSRNEEARNFYEQLFINISSWASTPPDRRTLTVEPVKPSFSEHEQVEMRATLINERGEPEPDGIVELYFYEGDDSDRRVFRMDPAGGGRYHSQLGSYPEGVYRLEAAAEKNNRDLGRAETRVTVRESSAELINTQRNDELLQQIAAITGGISLQHHQINNISTFLSENNLDEISENISTEFIYIFEAGWWFFVVVLLLSAEWLLRRSVSLP